MQRLQLLQSQQEVLQRRLSLRVPSPDTAPLSTTSPTNSFFSSPTSSRKSSTSWSPEPLSSAPSPLSSTAPHVSSSIEDASKLREVNEQIKFTLTELLNTDSVRSDVEFRAWIQDRLLDVEHEIRKQRRRHSAGDRQFARSIALHMSPESSFESRGHRPSI